MKIWKTLDNKKTNVGAGLMLAALVLQQGADIWLGAASPMWIPKTIESLHWLGGLFGGVGLAHKGVKAANRREP